MALYSSLIRVMILETLWYGTNLALHDLAFCLQDLLELAHEEEGAYCCDNMPRYIRWILRKSLWAVDSGSSSEAL